MNVCCFRCARQRYVQQPAAALCCSSLRIHKTILPPFHTTPDRLLFSRRHKRERAVLAGCAAGSDAPAVAVPLVEALAGPAGVVAACSALIANTLSGQCGVVCL